MPNSSLIVPENLFHKVPAQLAARKTTATQSLRAMLQLYVEEMKQ